MGREYNGYAGRIAWIDLQSRTIKIKPTSDMFALIGGRGIASAILLDNTEALVIAPGALTGTFAPTATRTSVAARNQITGGIVYSSIGGHFGPEMKFAGFDGLVITGKASGPVYLFLHNGKVDIVDAGHLWGKTVHETEKHLKQEINTSRVRSLVIGPPGERGAKISCIISDSAHAAGWGGLGAAAGLKNLKAVAALGSFAVGIHDPDRFLRKVKQLRRKMDSSEVLAALIRGGTHATAGVGGWTGKIPTAVRNLKDEYWPEEKSSLLKEEVFKRNWETGRVAGFSCPLACTHYYSAEREGEKINAEGMHANSVRGFGSNWDITDPLIVLKVHSICSEYGLDVDGVSTAVAWAMECFEEGLLTEKDTGGIKLCFGNGESALQVVEQIAAGVGFGALLEKGVAEAARITGRGTEKHAVTIKGTGINEQGMHTHLAWALGIAVSTRGGGHLGGSPQTENRRISREIGQRLFGVADAGIPEAWQGKGKLVAWYEGYKSLVDMLGLCYFSYGWYNIDMADPNDLAELYYYASGLDCDGDELLQAGRRNHLREKYFNMIHTDFSRKDDTLPERVMKIPVSGGEYQGRLIKREYLEKMLDEYYLSLGWDRATGLPGKELLKSEGIIK